MTVRRPTALIADDEPLLRETLTRQLAEAWPELNVIAQASNGRKAVEQFEAQHPDICFLDVHMPGVSGLEAARQIGRRAHLVFVTAYDKYAVQAFDQGALDYILKPVDPARLADTVNAAAGTPAHRPGAGRHRGTARTAAATADREAAKERSARTAALDPRGSGPVAAPNSRRRDRLLALGREIHAGRVAR